MQQKHVIMHPNHAGRTYGPARIKTTPQNTVV